MVLDIPWVCNQDTILYLQPCRTGLGDVHDPEQSFPHWRELVQAFSRVNPPEDKIANFELMGADVVTVVAV
jgi:hypothetical protein